MKRLQSPSLFWTFAGAFLAVLVAATIIQFLVIAGVLNPIMRLSAEARARSAAQDAARQIADAPSDSMRADARSILATYRHQLGPYLLAYQDADGHIHADRAMRGMLMRALSPPDSSVYDDSLHRPPFPRPGRVGDGSRPSGLTILARYPVMAGSASYGEVIVVAAERRFPLWPDVLPWPVLLFLPIAVILSGGAGLIMFRIFLRRIRALETLAARVTDGDLTARVIDPSADEIGRLGARLNRMTETLSIAQEQIGENDRQRRQLLADISHELATPLTSIRGYTETLLDPGVPISDEERKTFLRDVLHESERMDLLIQDLLDLTRLEAGAIQLTTERLDWTDLCRNTVMRFASRFAEVGLTIKWIGESKPAWVDADGRRLEQVLENLLTNALRYVPEGGTVTVSVDQLADRASPLFRLSVSDNGPGFAPEDLPHVFDRFYQADQARSTGGTGLGLAIVHEIVRRHDGHISAQNGPDGGALIEIDLPAAPPISS